MDLKQALLDALTEHCEGLVTAFSDTTFLDGQFDLDKVLSDFIRNAGGVIWGPGRPMEEALKGTKILLQTKEGDLLIVRYELGVLTLPHGTWVEQRDAECWWPLPEPQKEGE